MYSLHDKLFIIHIFNSCKELTWLRVDFISHFYLSKKDNSRSCWKVCPTKESSGCSGLRRRSIVLLPPSLRAAWLSYVPLPRQYFYSQFFGHVGRKCRRYARGLPPIWERCRTMHGLECMGESLRCVYCFGPHPALSKSRDRYLFEKKVVSLN